MEKGVRPFSMLTFPAGTTLCLESEPEQHERIEGLAGNMEELSDYQVTRSRHEEFYQIGFFYKSSTGRVASHGRRQMRSKYSHSFLDRERGTSGPVFRDLERGKSARASSYEYDNLSELDRVRNEERDDFSETVEVFERD
jgi:hypothetical protein